MNIAESTAIAEKLQSLMDTISEFGTESEQLKNVRNDFDKYLAAVKNTDVKMGEVIGKCNDYIDAAREFIERDLSEKVEEIVERTEQEIKTCFGTESEQLKNVRNDFDRYLAAVKNTDVKMGEVIGKCNDYIDATREFIERDLSEKVREFVERTKQAVTSCKEQCESVTEEYKETLALFEGQKEFFDNQRDNLTDSFTSGLDSKTAEIKSELQVGQELSEKVRVIVARTEQAVKHCNEQCESVKEQYKETLALLEVQKEFFNKQLEDLTDAFTSGLDSNAAEIKSQLQELKQLRQKDAFMIKICSSAAIVAALAAIIGLLF